MNSTVQTILETIGVLLLAEVLSKLGSYILKKYRIMERKIFLKVFVLFLLGLLFIVEAVVFLAIEISNGTLDLSKGLLIAGVFSLGVILTVILVRLVVVQVNEPPKAVSQKTRKPWLSKEKKSQLTSWVFMVGGALLTAACIYLFYAYGPQHDPPGMTSAHQAMDMVINLICGSTAIVGVVMFIAGLRRLTRIENTLP